MVFTPIARTRIRAVLAVAVATLLAPALAADPGMAAVPSVANVLENGDFASRSLGPWTTFTNDPANQSASVVQDENGRPVLRMDVRRVAAHPEPWHLQARQS